MKYLIGLGLKINTKIINKVISLHRTNIYNIIKDDYEMTRDNLWSFLLYDKYLQDGKKNCTYLNRSYNSKYTAWLKNYMGCDDELYYVLKNSVALFGKNIKSTFKDMLGRNLLNKGFVRTASLFIININITTWKNKRIINNYIKNDDLLSIKKLFIYKIVRPTDISENSSFMDTSVTHNSLKVIEYFDNELCMNASSNYISNITSMRRYRVHNILKPMKNLIDIGYKPTHNILMKCITANHTKTAHYLMDYVDIDNKDSFKIISSGDKALINKASKKIDFQNIKYTGLFDKFIILKLRNIRRYYNYSRQRATRSTQEKSIINSIKEIVKNYPQITPTKRSIDAAINSSMYVLMKYLHKTYKIQIDYKNLAKSFSSYRSANIISTVIYVSKLPDVDIKSMTSGDKFAESFAHYTFNAKFTVTNALELFTGLNKYHAVTIMMKTHANNKYALDVIKAIDTQDDYGKLYVLAKGLRCMDIVKYFNKIPIVPTQKDFNTILAYNPYNINNIIKYNCEIDKLTPYAIEIILLSVGYYGKFSSDFILELKSKNKTNITYKTKKKIKQILKYNNNGILNKEININEFNVVEYIPEDTERLDVPIVDQYDYLYENDSDSDKSDVDIYENI